MPKGPVHCLTAHILVLSLQPEGLVTPIHLSRVNVHERLRVLEVTEMSSPNKTPYRCQRSWLGFSWAAQTAALPASSKAVGFYFI